MSSKGSKNFKLCELDVLTAEELSSGNLYRLPFSKEDNPNGWLEITTHCNMTCSGCYRGCDRSDNNAMHKNFEKIKEEIITLKKMRNCSMISISGGEPLLHPQIMKIVTFVKKQGMEPVVFTNGKLLDRDMLSALKKSGLTGVLIRIDSLREAEEVAEASLNKLREKYARLCMEQGIYLGFSCVIDKSNLTEVPDVVQWVEHNHESVDLLLLIPGAGDYLYFRCADIFRQ